MNVLQKILDKVGLSYRDESFEYMNGCLIFEEPGVEISLNFPEIKDESVSTDYINRVDELQYILLDTKKISENDIYKLKINGVSQLGDSRLGWVFSLSALYSQDQLDRLFIEDKFGYNFAISAIYQMIYSREIHEFISYDVINQLSENSSLNLEDIYGINSAIAVISKNSMRRLNVDTEEIKVILMAEQYIPKIKKLEENNLFNDININDSTNPYETIGMNKLSDSIDKTYLKKFILLLRLALYENNSISSFLNLYQILEYLSLEVFKEKINFIKSNSDIDSWKLKEQLSNLTNELSRLNLAFNNFLSPNFSVEQETIESLSAHCKNFLDKCSSSSTQNDAYVKLLYKVRNILVHKQIDLPDNSIEDLFEINKLLFEIIFRLLKGFDKTIGLRSLES